MIFSADKQKQRLKWSFENCKNGTWGEEPDGEHDVDCIRAADFDGKLGTLADGERTKRAVDPDTYTKTKLSKGDVIIEKSGGGEKQLVGRAVLYLSEEKAVCSNFLARCKPAENMDSKFINYLLLAIYVARGTYPHIKQSTGIQNLDLSSFLDTKVDIPPLKTQKHIAQFLDQKTAQIDGLIEKKRALLERLAEKRQALITQAVTKGLNPNAPMKPSGIDWLGDIPAHWEVKRLRFLLDGGTINGLYKPKEQFSPDGFAFVQMGEAFRAVTFDGGTKDRVLASDSEVKKWGLKEGDFLIARRSLVFEGSGKAVKINKLEENHLFESSMIRIRPISADKLSDFLSYYFQSSVCRAFFLSITKQVTISGIDSQQLKDVSVPMPPLDEAARIQQLCLESDQNHGVVTESILRSISQLNEYRAALITSAITGKLAFD